jgi:hypothetical protein
MANAVNMQRPDAFFVDDPHAVLFNEPQSETTIDVIDRVEDNSVTKKELRWAALAALVAGIALCILAPHVTVAIVVATGLFIGMAWLLNKSRNITPIIRDAKKYAWHATHLGKRLSPKEEEAQKGPGLLGRLAQAAFPDQRQNQRQVGNAL